jgi:hypothetical protein
MDYTENDEVIQVEVQDIQDIIDMLYGTQNIILKTISNSSLDIRHNNIIVLE